MGASQRRKGARGELEACAVMADLLGGAWTRGGSAQRRQGPDRPADIVSEAWRGLHVEVKRGQRVHLGPAYDQAVGAAAPWQLAVVLARRDRDPIGWVTVRPWLAGIDPWQRPEDVPTLAGSRARVWGALGSAQAVWWSRGHDLLIVEHVALGCAAIRLLWGRQPGRESVARDET